MKEQVRITVETNTVTASTATNLVAPKEKMFQWKSAWEGWNGLHFELSKRTRFEDPLRELWEKRPETNTYRVLRLEELKMSGKIGGKLAVDASGYVTGNEFQDFDPGVELRRARVYTRGDCLLVLPVSYELEIGYIPHEFYLENSYLSFKDIRWIGELKGGQFQPPMGLDLINSSRDIAFMEPASAIQALAPGTSAGLQIGRPAWDRRAAWRLGAFTDGVGTDFGDASRDYGRVISRFTGLPLWTTNQDGNPKFLHLGVSANVLYSGNSTVRYRSRPESHLAPYVVDTGNLAAEGSLVAGAEAAWVNGPWSIQGEYLHSWVKDDQDQTPEFQGVYAATSWLLTGESRPYDRTEGLFGRVIPKRNFNFGRGGWGAWEMAARLSYVDLDSGDIHGGRLTMLMGGINWYLHSHLKWRFDYGLGHVSDRTPGGNLQIFQTRLELDF